MPLCMPKDELMLEFILSLLRPIESISSPVKGLRYARAVLKGDRCLEFYGDLAVIFICPFFNRSHVFLREAKCVAFMEC